MFLFIGLPSIISATVQLSFWLRVLPFVTITVQSAIKSDDECDIVGDRYLTQWTSSVLPALISVFCATVSKFTIYEPFYPADNLRSG